MRKNLNLELKNLILEKFLKEAAAISATPNINKDIKQKIFSILHRAFGVKTSFGDEKVNQNKYYKKFFNDIISYVEKDRMNKYLGEIRNTFISRYMESNNGQIPSQQQIEDKINQIKDDKNLVNYFKDAGINDLDEFLKNSLKQQVDISNNTTETFHNFILKNVSKFAKTKIKNMFQGIKLELIPKKIELIFDKDIKIGDLQAEIDSLKNKTNKSIQDKYLLLFYTDLNNNFIHQQDIGKFYKFDSNANKSLKPVNQTAGYIKTLNSDQEIILNGKKIIFQQVNKFDNYSNITFLDKKQFFKIFNISDNDFEDKHFYSNGTKSKNPVKIYKIHNINNIEVKKPLELQNNIELNIKDSKNEIDLDYYIENLNNITISGGNDIFTSILKRCLGFTDKIHGIEKFLENDYDITKIENIEVKSSSYKNILIKLDKKIKDYFSIGNQNLNTLLNLDKIHSEILFDFNQIKIGNMNFEEFLKSDITFNNTLIKKINNLDANMSYNAPEFDATGKQKLVTQNEKFINHFIEIDPVDKKKYITLDNIFALIIIKIFCNANEFMFEIYYILSRLQVAIAYRFNELYSSINLVSSSIDDTQKQTTKKINVSIDGSHQEEFIPKQYNIDKKVSGSTTTNIISDDQKFDDFIEFLNKKTNLYNKIVPLNTNSYTKITLDDIKKSLGLMDEILIDGVDYGYENIVSDQIILLLYNRKDYGLGAGEHLLILYLLGVNVGNLILNKIIKRFRSKYGYGYDTLYETSVSDMLDYFHTDQQNWYSQYFNDISSGIEEILKSYFIYSGGTEHGDINFKKSLPTGIKSTNDINKKIFETKKIEGLSSEFRVGSQGIRALSKFTPKIIECGEIINDLINDDNLYQGKNLNKILFSEVLGSLSNDKNNEANIKFLNKYFPKSGHHELPSLFETESATYNGFQAGGQKFSNISSLVMLKKLIQNILENIIKEYHYGTQKFIDKSTSEDLFGTIITGKDAWVGGKSVYISDKSNKEGEFTFPIDIHSKKPEDNNSNNILLTIDSHDIINLIRDHEIRDDITSHDEKKKKIKKAFKLENVNEIHIELLTLAIKYYNRLRRIDLREIEKNISNLSYVKPSECFTGIDYLIISNYSEPSASPTAVKKSASEMLTFYFIPINKLDDYLIFTSTSQLRPQFKLKSITP